MIYDYYKIIKFKIINFLYFPIFVIIISRKFKYYIINYKNLKQLLNITMRKTIFLVALFTVILSYSVSKAELFLEDVELVEYEDEELAAAAGTTTKTSSSTSKILTMFKMY